MYGSLFCPEIHSLPLLSFKFATYFCEFKRQRKFSVLSESRVPSFWGLLAACGRWRLSSHETDGAFRGWEGWGSSVSPLR